MFSKEQFRRMNRRMPERALSYARLRLWKMTPSRVNEVQQPASFISLSVRAGEVFANREKALGWLQSANPSLQGRSPIEAANTQQGFEEADEILTRIEHGVLG